MLIGKWRYNSDDGYADCGVEYIYFCSDLYSSFKDKVFKSIIWRLKIFDVRIDSLKKWR